jgi:ribosomal-protein-alanine acetyltransferase
MPLQCRLARLQAAHCAALSAWLPTTLEGGDWGCAALLQAPAEGTQRWVLLVAVEEPQASGNFAGSELAGSELAGSGLAGSGLAGNEWVDAAAVESAVLGFAEVRLVLDEAEVLALAIAPAWQGQGLGRLLLRQVLAKLRGQGCRRCLLEVRRSNLRAQQLYLQAGFVQDGLRKAYYAPRTPGALAEDALLYSCRLESSLSN